MAELQALELMASLASRGVTHLVGLPDNTSAALFALPLSPGADIQRLTVTREGEAFAIAAGLWMGGKSPAVVCQNTGLLESGDSLRGTAMRMGVPLPVIVTYRGFATLSRVSSGDGDLHRRPDVDSVAVLTEPTLEAWGLPWDWLRDRDDMDAAIDQARAESCPVVRLLAQPLG